MLKRMYWHESQAAFCSRDDGPDGPTSQAAIFGPDLGRRNRSLVIGDRGSEGSPLVEQSPMPLSMLTRAWSMRVNEKSNCEMRHEALNVPR